MLSTFACDGTGEAPQDDPRYDDWRMTRALIGIITLAREMEAFNALSVPGDPQEAWDRIVALYRQAVPREESLVESVQFARFEAALRTTKQEIAKCRLAIVGSEQGAVHAGQLLAELATRARAPGDRRGGVPARHREGSTRPGERQLD